MQRLIDAEKLFDFIQKEKAWKQDTYKQPRYGRGKYDAYYEMLDIIKEQPTIDAEPVVHGHWINSLNCKGTLPYYEYKCSICGRTERKREPYCNCGAKMDEEAK